MAVGTIIIQKIEPKNDDTQNIGFYEISSNDFDVNNFYICIDKSKKIVSFFLTKDFSKKPIHIVDYNKDVPIGLIPGIPMKVFTVTLMHSIEVFRTNTFPDSLSYAA